MKKFLVSCLSLALVFLTGCKEEPETPVPTLEVAGGNVTMTVSADGGTQSIAYSITNPVDGGEIQATSAESWINGFNYDTENQIVFNVDPNEVPEARSSVLTVTYIYGEGLAVKKDVNVIQNAGIDWAYQWEMSNFSSYWYGDMYGMNGEHNYYTWLSDIPFTDDGYTQPGGTYYLFDIYAAAPADEEVPQIPAGTYTLGEAGSTAEWTFSIDYSKAVRYNSEGQEWSATFTEGTLTISYNDDGTAVMEAALTDTEGLLHHLTYTGEAVCMDGRPVLPGVGFDLEFDPIQAYAVYAYDDGTNMEVSIQFTDMDVDEDNYVIPPGTLLTVDTYMPLDKDGKIEPGTYTVSTEGTAGTLYPGTDFLGLMYVGTYAQYILSDEEYYVTLVSEGTMEITENGDGTLTFDCDFVCADGYALRCSWTGELTVQGMPGPISTLTGDYTLDLEGATGIAQYFGDYYATGGGNWMGLLSPTTGPDGFQFEIVCADNDFTNGISTGTYKASASTSILNPGEYLPGYMGGSSLYGTMYVGGYTEDGYVTQFAPAMSGDLNITNHGDGTYTFVFAFVDDLGYTWDGEWTGELSVTDKSQSSVRTNYVEAPAKAQLTKQEVATKVSEQVIKVGEISVPATKSPMRKPVR